MKDRQPYPAKLSSAVLAFILCAWGLSAKLPSPVAARLFPSLITTSITPPPTYGKYFIS